MAKKPAKPVRKSPAKTKSRKPVAKGSAAAKGRSTAVRKVAGRNSAKPLRKTTSHGATRHGVKKLVGKAKSGKLVAKKKVALRPAESKLKGGKAAPKDKVVAKPLKLVGKPTVQPIVAVAKPLKGVPGKPIAAGLPGHKPTAGEIAAKIAGKRAEDAASKKGRNGRHAEMAPRVLTPADVEARKRRLKTLIVLGKERGFLTFAEINDHLPDDVLDAEQIEGIVNMIGDMGIQVYDEAPDAESLLMSDATPTTPAEDV